MKILLLLIVLVLTGCSSPDWEGPFQGPYNVNTIPQNLFGVKGTQTPAYR